MTMDGYVAPGATVEIRIGGRSATVSPEHGGRIDSLSTNEKLVVEIRERGKTKASFFLDFKKEGSDSLCLMYYLGYGTWSIHRMADCRSSEKTFFVLIGVKAPFGHNRDTLSSLLKSEGLEPFPEGEEAITVGLTEKQVARLFGARIVFRTLEKSAVHRQASTPCLEHVRIPARFQRFIESVDIDPQL